MISVCIVFDCTLRFKDLYLNICKLPQATTWVQRLTRLRERQKSSNSAPFLTASAQ